MIDPTPLPGLAEHTVVLIGAGTALGKASALTLLASGATVLATANPLELPESLVDAGTGLPGELHYRSFDQSNGTASADDATALSDWVGEQTPAVHGIVIHEGGEEVIAALSAHLIDTSSVVLVGAGQAGALQPSNPTTGIRTNIVDPHPDSEPLAVASAIAFLISEHAEFVDGAVVPIQKRHPPAI